jgi:hypothetical protein
MKRSGSIFLLIVSSLLLIAVGVTWRIACTQPLIGDLFTNRSHRQPLMVTILQENERHYWLSATETNVGLHNLPSDLFRTYDWLQHSYQQRGFLFVGNGFVRKTYFDGRTSWHLFVPYWLIVLIAAISPIRWLIRLVRRWRRSRAQRKRIRLGQCRACGYDLTANNSGTCPECGEKTGPQAEEVEA